MGPPQEQRDNICDLGYVSRRRKNTSRIWCLRELNGKEKNLCKRWLLGQLWQYKRSEEIVRRAHKGGEWPAGGQRLGPERTEFKGGMELGVRFSVC